MRMVDLIEKKASGDTLDNAEIAFMIRGYVAGSIPDYQMSAMMMAIRDHDMTSREAADLTMEMMHSGDVVDLTSIPGVKVDKHSTGGVADTTTLIIAPLAAACGAHVAKMSGRGLGHTGGTLDKLESIPGVCVEQPLDKFQEIVRSIGLCVVGQSGNLVPADKKMYALRDVTATVRSIPLIASSIMSKKLAAGTDAIVLDVKTGSGAFMETRADADRLADLMVGIGKHLGRRVEALVTDMNQPLGTAIGNALEVREAIHALSGLVPHTDPLMEVSFALGARMLMLSNLAKDEDDGIKKLQRAIRDGSGLDKLRQMISALGGDEAYIDPVRIDELCRVREKRVFCADRAGRIASMNTEKIGMAAQLLGAGRATKADIIDPAVGIIMQKRLCDRVEKGEPLLTLHINDATNAAASERLLREAFTIE